jgi:chromosome segregation ATPase
MPYINKIELRGFKSFGNTKITLPLSRGLTTIVGRNWSGKSNIVDAFCFVFGGRSGKVMRTERFSDFIYAKGEQTIAPFAEVTLHIDNRDSGLSFESSFVAISRRVDRTGKCTYKINGKRSDLQEITDLLAPVMGAPEGYNFVMQDEVKKIFGMTAMERREVIDRLAGIAEYEEKKEKSNRELQEVNQQLHTLSALLEQEFTQVDKLKQQVQDALRQKQLTLELDQVHGAILQKRISELETKQKRFNRRSGDVKSKVKTLDDKRKELIKKASALGVKASELQRTIDEKRNSAILDKAGTLRGELKACMDLLRSTKEARDQILAKMNAAKESLGHKGKASTVLGQMDRFKELSSEFESLGESLGKSKSVDEAKEIVEKIRGTLKELSVTITGLFSTLSAGKVSEVDSGHIREVTGIDVNLQFYEGQIKTLSEKIEKAKAQLQEIGFKETKLRLSIASLDRQRSGLNKKADEMRSAADEIQGKIDDLREKASGRAGEEASVAAELKSSRQELTKIKADPTPLLRLDKSALEHKATTLQQQMDSLGQVNQLAARELRDAQSCYDGKKGVQDKLLADQQGILNFIKEMDEKKKKVFMKTFDVVSQQFSFIFHELTVTGAGKLSLENAEDPFQGGLEMEADFGEGTSRQRGLSGGQRSLTSLAFLLALQRCRPSTFYVMDEIDANLDSYNRQRVADILQKFSKESQILVVTLHDSIAAASDRIFGVTKENGVSRILSVELSGLGG